ncbi:RNA polymerase sigma factor [Dorea longicatena]|jgi:RNA polymerase sigma factor (sigma-70 family)|nr:MULTISPECIES: RNA polymerase sigma factor [Clostridia]MBN3031215.1 RNA polymerase sigma factor [Ruthenibacterium lactatiformans]NSC55917.1 RNA polymerase sigma factor [Dorea longicatena]NSD08241.1 RNA polymerase sigma factor [Dorea longicatena]NSF11518.1 RNA polymerase sigma factor [Dorea longicatena]
MKLKEVMTSMDYEKLYKAYYLQVYSYTISLAKNREIAEEIAQNTFYKAVSTTSQFKGKSDELTWLCSIAKNLYHDEMRSRQRVADVSEINDLPSNENVENSVADSDMAFRIHLVLHRLEEPYKEVFQLRVFGELSFSQIAAIFGKTESWARVTYHRAKLKIQERMDEKHE